MPPKKHQCFRCGRTFARAEHLQRHERSHTKEKPFSCSKCSQAFTRKDLLDRHGRLIHGDQKKTRPTIGTSTAPASASPFQGILPSSFPEAGDPGPNPPFPLRQDYPATGFSGQTFESPTTYHRDDILAAENLQSFANLSQLDAFDPSEPSTTDDFSSFLDSIEMSIHPFSPLYQPLPYLSPGFDLAISNSHIIAGTLTNTLERPGLDGETSDFSRFGSRLPSLQPEAAPRNHPQIVPGNVEKVHAFPEVTSQGRNSILRKLESFSGVVGNEFVLPSRHALSRFFARYVSGFHEHYPFLHIPTLSIETLAVELTLSIAAMGAQYCREPEKNLQLFQAARAVALERIRRRSLSRSLVASTGHFGGKNIGYRLIETVQALLILMAIATWLQRQPNTREALSIRGILDSLSREDGLNLVVDPTDKSWEDWVHKEGRKRTKLLLFCFFNLHLIVFDIPPLILSSEIDMDLPCPESEWKSNREADWKTQIEARTPEPAFQDTFQSLFRVDDKEMRHAPSFSSLGGYVLIHALIQHIWLLQQTNRLTTSRDSGLPISAVTSLESALRRWRYGWERDKERSMDPLSPHGPIPFTSTALLRLAYIRLNINAGSFRLLSTWDPQRIARSLNHSPPICRSDKMTRAALHCAHALSIPIKLGINFVAHTQVFFWSNQHALCSLECALLLAKWLESVTLPNPDPALSVEETRLLDFVVHMVAETEYDALPSTLFQHNKYLSAVVVRVWAKLFRPDSIWEMVDLIGRSLRAYADLLESRQ